MTKGTRRALGVYCPGAGTGGPWRYVHSILAGLAEDEFDVTLFCDLPGAYEPRRWMKVVRLGGPIARPGGAAAVDSTDARPRSALSRITPETVRIWAGFAKQARRLARLFRQHPVDLFHTQNTGCEESPVAARWAGVPKVIGTFHVDSTYDLRRVRSGFAHRTLEHVSNRSLDVGVAVSKATGRDWIRRTLLSRQRVVTIPNGVDPERFRRRRTIVAARERLRLPGGGLLVGAVGRLEEAKGFTYLLRAAPRLLRQHPVLNIVIAGDGPLRSSLESEARELGVSRAVHFLGYRDEVQSVLEALDLFVLPSLCEAAPYAVLEAMAMGLPVAATAVGGVPEIVSNEETGLIVPAQDSEALACALDRLLESQDLRARMGAAGRARVLGRFQERDMVERTIQLYRDVLARKSPRLPTTVRAAP